MLIGRICRKLEVAGERGEGKGSEFRQEGRRQGMQSADGRMSIERYRSNTLPAP